MRPTFQSSSSLEYSSHQCLFQRDNHKFLSVETSEMNSWPIVVLIIFELLQTVGCFRSQHFSIYSTIRLQPVSNSAQDGHAPWNTKYVTRSILLENALAREKNTTHELYGQVVTLKGEKEYFQSQLESANVQTVLLDSELATSRQRERKFKVRSILLEEITRKLKIENRELREMLELASSSSSATTSSSPLSVPHTEVSLLSSSSKIPRTILDPVVMDSFDNYSSDMNVQLKRALSILSSSIKELLALFLLKCAQAIDTVNRIYESNRGSLYLSCGRFIRNLMRFLYGHFPTRKPPSSSASRIQQPHLLPNSSYYNSWNINYSIESIGTEH